MAMKRKNLPEVVPELFEHEQFGQFRYIKRGEELWFVAVDLCRALDIQNPRDVVAKQLDDDEKDVDTIYTLGGPQKVNIVSEPGLYHLIFISRKPEAKKFRRWVFHEVLPSIRKYGFYGLLNGEQARQLPIGQYLSYLGKLTTEQYMAYLRQLTTEQYLEHYARLEERIPYMTEEEKLNLPDDPDIIVMRFQNEKKWRVKIYV